MNPDEVVAMGAAIQAGVSAGRREGRCSSRRDPAVTLAIETAWRCLHPPDRPQHDHPDEEKSQTFSTAEDQSERGDHPRVPGRTRDGRRTTRCWGQFNLEDIPPAPRGVPQIEVTFDIDANGIVSVSGQGQRHRQGSEDHDPGLRWSQRRGHRKDGQGRRGERRGGQGTP